MNATQRTYAITIDGTSFFRGTREQMLARIAGHNLSAVKRGYTTWRLYSGTECIGRVDEV